MRLLLLPALPLFACAGPESACDVAPGGGPGENVLIILTDDIGLDKTGVSSPLAPPTPNIDALAAQGMLFRNAYACPTCSPSRASLLTGRHPTRHGIGRWIYPPGHSEQLSRAEMTIPRMLEQSPSDYVSALVGKWHLTGFDGEDPGMHPLDLGFQCHAGSIGNPLDALSGGHFPRSYTRWEKMWDGQPGWTHDYMTTDTSNEAIARIRQMREPWFMVVAYNAAHEPLHQAPDSLHGYALDENSTDVELYDAMVESVDTEIGRMLAAIPSDMRERTTIVYLSDNGTPAAGVTGEVEAGQNKGSVYDGGVRVPLIVQGPRVAVPGSQSDALVHLVDLLPTVAEIASVDLDQLRVEEGEGAGLPVELDGESLVPLLEDPTRSTERTYLFTEGFYPNGEQSRSYTKRMLRDPQWKLVELVSSGIRTETLHLYAPGSYDEGPDLLVEGPMDEEAVAALARLRWELDETVSALEGG